MNPDNIIYFVAGMVTWMAIDWLHRHIEKIDRNDES